jgi:hypothetical protein
VIETSSFYGTPQSRYHPFPLFLPEDGSTASFRNVVFKEKKFDDGYRPKTRFFEMHHTIVRTLQDRFYKCIICDFE